MPRKTINLDVLITELNMYRNEHGGETLVDFWDTENDRPLQLVDQSLDEPGIEGSVYSCGCFCGITLNFEAAPE